MLLAIVSDYILQIASAFFTLLQEIGFHFFVGLLACVVVLAVVKKPLGKAAAIVCVALFPACNYTAPALAAGVAFRHRYSPVPTIAFLVATLISPATLAYTVGVFGWMFTLAYVAVAALAAWIVWVVSKRFQVGEKQNASKPTALRNITDLFGSASNSEGPLPFLRHAAPRVAAALLLGCALYSILSPALGQFIQTMLARTPLLSPADIVIAAFGMHFCAPDDFALVALVAQSGLPIGAAGALMLLGLLTNLPEAFALAVIAGKRQLLIFLSAVISSTAVFALAIQLLAGFGVVGSIAPVDTGSFVAVVNQVAIITPSFLATPCAIALLLLGLYGVFLMSRPGDNPHTNIDSRNET